MPMTRIRRGKAKIGGDENHVHITYSGFSSVPVVCATVSDTLKNGPCVSLRDIKVSSCEAFAFYNAGHELYEGTIEWVAVGFTSEVRVCVGHHFMHICHPDVYA